MTHRIPNTSVLSVSIFNRFILSEETSALAENCNLSFRDCVAENVGAKDNLCVKTTSIFYIEYIKQMGSLFYAKNQA